MGSFFAGVKKMVVSVFISPELEKYQSEKKFEARAGDLKKLKGAAPRSKNNNY